MPKQTVNDVIEELTMLSSKATQGKWWIDSHGHSMTCFTDGGDMEFIFITDSKAMSPGKGPTRHENGNLSYWHNDWDASFIASAQPKNIQMLLKEIERLRGLVDENSRN